MNRREFNTGFVTILAYSALPSSASTAPLPDYGDPDIEFRDFNVKGASTSGQYKVMLQDGEKWCERLQLPKPQLWGHYIRENGFRMPHKAKLREACHKWIASVEAGEKPYRATFESIL
jgi:hypothetical protein